MTAKAQRRHRLRRPIEARSHELGLLVEAAAVALADGRDPRKIARDIRYVHGDAVLAAVLPYGLSDALAETEPKRRPFSWLTWGAVRHRAVAWLRARGLAKQRRGNYAAARYTQGRRRRR